MEIKNIHHEVIESTNTWCKVNAHTLDPKQLTVVTADSQTAGRGRFSRTWVSPAGQNIYASFCFFLPELTPNVVNIPQVLAVSICKVLKNMASVSPRLRWPNDIMLNGKKLGGTLCETTPADKQHCIVLGIGLNVNMTAEEISTIDRPATSLLVETGSSHDIKGILKSIEQTFASDLQFFLKEGFIPFLQPFSSLLLQQKGDQLRLSDFQKVWEGAFDSVNADGSINLQLPLNEIRTFLSGEILDAADTTSQG